MDVVIITVWDSLRGFGGCNLMSYTTDVIGQWVYYYRNGFDLGMLMVSAHHIPMGFFVCLFFCICLVCVICERGIIHPNSNKHIPVIIL